MSVTGSARSLALVGLVLLGLWVAFRIVNVPRFADFLISVEAEMNKVSWPSKTELWRATAVVIFVIFALSFILFMFDAIWSFLFKLLQIRYLG
jgi:preprotein translocase subunit SecE